MRLIYQPGLLRLPIVFWWKESCNTRALLSYHSLRRPDPEHMMVVVVMVIVMAVMAVMVVVMTGEHGADDVMCDGVHVDEISRQNRGQTMTASHIQTHPLKRCFHPGFQKPSTSHCHLHFPTHSASSSGQQMMECGNGADITKPRCRSGYIADKFGKRVRHNISIHLLGSCERGSPSFGSSVRSTVRALRHNSLANEHGRMDSDFDDTWWMARLASDASHVRVWFLTTLEMID